AGPAAGRRGVRRGPRRGIGPRGSPTGPPPTRSRRTRRCTARCRRPCRPWSRVRHAVARRSRLDAELVRRGLARSREQAAELVSAGRVEVRGTPASKPAALVDPADPVRVTGATEGYVSRGAYKLAGALAASGVPVEG